ncbi:MAG: hypothetical protein Q9164_002695 [Protoblastenia rupestris]
MDNTVTAALQDLGKAQPWLLCLVLSDGNKNACLDKVRQANLVTSEPKVMAVLLFLSLNGVWALIFLGRTSMVVGWRDLIRGHFTENKTDFVSVDARRISADKKQYEMMMSPPSRPYSMPREPEAVIASPPTKEVEPSSLPQSPSSHYEDEYFGKETYINNDAHPYLSPKLSFSTPRPPSAGQTFSKNVPNSRRFSRDSQTANRTFSPQFTATGRPFTPSRTESRAGAYSPPIEWDPTSTHAKPSR